MNFVKTYSLTLYLALDMTEKTLQISEDIEVKHLL